MIQLDGLVIICSQPSEINRDGENRMHSINGPSIKWRDGYKLWYLNGIYFEYELWEKVISGKMSAREVLDIENTEQRRVAYDLMDKKKLQNLPDFKVLDEAKDNLGKPMRVYQFTHKLFPNLAKIFHCVDASTDREYHLFTDKNTCNEAKAAMWGLSADEIEWGMEY